MQQVFYNLLDNAIKYSFEKSIIKAKLIKENNILLFQVNNKGIEISETDIEHIGERFFRTDKARSRSTGGTGLGISIVKEIVRLHGGSFSISSHSSNGTTVSIMLPLLL
jgi:signal transduction histidine kinase